MTFILLEANHLLYDPNEPISYNEVLGNFNKFIAFIFLIIINFLRLKDFFANE